MHAVTCVQSAREIKIFLHFVSSKRIATVKLAIGFRTFLIETNFEAVGVGP
jgi:hypothetical protein